MGRRKSYGRRMLDFGYEVTMLTTALGSWQGLNYKPEWWPIWVSAGGLAAIRLLYSIPESRRKLPSPDFALSFGFIGHKSEFIFRGRTLESVVTISRFTQFCEVACRRQRQYYHGRFRARGWGERVTMREMEILSAAYFQNKISPGFTSVEVNDCKKVLKLTGQLIKWQPGHGGVLVGENPRRLVDHAQETFYPPPLWRSVMNLSREIVTSISSKRFNEVHQGS